MSENFVSTLAPIENTVKSLLNNHKIVSDVSTSSTSSLMTSAAAALVVASATATMTSTSSKTTVTASPTTSTAYEIPVTTTFRPCKLIFCYSWHLMFFILCFNVENKIIEADGLMKQQTNKK